MPSIKAAVTDRTDTVCPVCWESVHGEKPVGVTTGCGHIWHQSCYRTWKSRGEYVYESSTTSLSMSQQQQQQQSRHRECYYLNSHLNCLICNQPTQSFVDLFIRLPPATPNHKDMVTKLEYEFHTVSRRTQLSLEKEIARREFEQTWLQEERQLSLVARQRVEERHAKRREELESDLNKLKTNYQRKIMTMESQQEERWRQSGRHPHRRRRRRSSTSSSTSIGIGDSNNHYFNSSSSHLAQQNNIRLALLGLEESSDSLSLTAIIYHHHDNDDDNGVEQELTERNEMEDVALGDGGDAAQITTTTTTSREPESATNEPHLPSSQLFDDQGFLLPETTGDAEDGSLLEPGPSLLSGSIDMNDGRSLQQTREEFVSRSDSHHTTHHSAAPAPVIISMESHCSSQLLPPRDNTTAATVGAAAAATNTSISDNSGGNSSDDRSGKISPRTVRRATRRMIQKDTIFHPEEAKKETKPAATSPTLSHHHQRSVISKSHSKKTTRTRRSILKDEIFVPNSVVNGTTSTTVLPVTDTTAVEETKLPASSEINVIANTDRQKRPSGKENNKHLLCLENSNHMKTSASGRALGSLKKNGVNYNDSSTYNVVGGSGASCCDFRKAPAACSLSPEYERQRLQAETAYYQHQAELVEWELQQAEIELEQDELELRERELRIRLERSRLEESFTSIQRRVEETKRESRDRQKLTAMEEKFIKYKIARHKEDERFEQELEHLKQDEVHILEREKSEKQRQEVEKVRLKKELNQLVKVMNQLEKAKELAKLAEEQSSASQSLETCVVCFEPLVNEESELGVAVPCGHTFHSACFNGWEKSKRRRGSNVPCPLCNVGTNLCVTIRLNRPGCSLYCPSTSSLAKHFQREEGRWQRRRLTGLGVAGEASS